LICAADQGAIRCPDGYYCTQTSKPVCCLISPTYDVAKRPQPPIQSPLTPPRLGNSFDYSRFLSFDANLRIGVSVPRAPGQAPYIARPQGNTFTPVDTVRINADRAKWVPPEHDVLLGPPPATLVDLGKAHQRFVVNTVVQPETKNKDQPLIDLPKTVAENGWFNIQCFKKYGKFNS